MDTIPRIPRRLPERATLPGERATLDPQPHQTGNVHAIGKRSHLANFVAHRASMTNKESATTAISAEGRVAALLPDLLTIEEVATYLKISKNTLYGWRVSGQGPAARLLGKHLRYHRDDVLSWVAGTSTQVSA